MRIRVSMWAAVCTAVLLSPAVAADLDQRVAAELPALVELYKELHRQPELSYHEERTAARMAESSRRLSRSGCAETVSARRWRRRWRGPTCRR